MTDVDDAIERAEDDRVAVEARGFRPSVVQQDRLVLAAEVKRLLEELAEVTQSRNRYKQKVQALEYPPAIDYEPQVPL